MAASSPVKGSIFPASSISAATLTGSNSSKSLRGLNKPKCIKCGNVARSRCPYQSCKNCCAKAQNPCVIHVLKGSSSFPDKTPSSNSPLFDQQSTEVSHTGNSQRLRQLSNNFAQFSNLQTPPRSRKPLTRKEAQVINEWRFLKLKEFKDGNIKTENEAFDRYIQNVSLLEEVFSVNSTPDEQIQDEKFSEENVERMVQSLKLKLRSNPVRANNLRKRIQYIVDQGLMKLGKFESIDGNTGEISDMEEVGKINKKIKSCEGERDLAVNDVCDKLNKAQNEDDLKACREMASQIFGWNTNSSQKESDNVLISGEMDPKYERKLDSFPQKWVSTTTMDIESFSRLDEQFSSLKEIGI